MDLILSYVSRSSFITIFVLIWLSLYFILTFTILISRFFALKIWQQKEQKALENILRGGDIENSDSVLRKCVGGNFSRQKLEIGLSVSKKQSTSGLSWLSIIASTSPFIGLFGTVIAILQTFSKLGSEINASLNVIAPAISEALVATGCGIFVAIPAYTFHILIKRKAYEIISTIEREVEILVLMQDTKSKDE